MKIIIPFKTPTINQMYATWNGNRVKSKEARDLALKVIDLIKPLKLKKPKNELKVTIEVYSNWYNKDKTIKHRDIANLEKFIIDSVFNALGIDDSLIFELILKKVDSNEEKSILYIEELSNL